MDFAAAEALFHRAAGERRGDTSEEEARILLNVGIMRAQQANYAGAVEAMLRAVRIHDELDSGESANLLQNLGALYFHLEEWEQSGAYSRRAIEAAGPGALLTASLYSNIGAAQIRMNRPEEAEASFRESLRITELHETLNPQAANNLGDLLRTRGQNESALALFEQAEAAYAGQGHTELIAVAKKNQGETWINLGDRKRAARLLQEAHDLYVEMDVRPKRLELYPVMIDNLEALGRTAEALTLMKTFKALNDETVNVEAKERVAKLETAYSLERKERELAASARDRALQEKAIQALQNDQQFQRTVRLGLLTALSPPAPGSS